MNKVFLGDCLDLLPDIESDSIDMILCDLPYGTTQNKWDSIIPLDKLWMQYRRIIKPNGAIVLTAAQPFTSILVVSNLEMFKYEWIWSKTIGSGQLNIRHQPLRTHESVLVFYSKVPTYNPQLTKGTPYNMLRKAEYEGPGYGKQSAVSVKNDGFRYPKSVLPIANPRLKGGHPTQKPIELFEYLVLTYSNEGDTVLDSCIGSGTTAIAALKTNRQFIGIELEPKYYEMSLDRIEKFYSENH